MENVKRYEVYNKKGYWASSYDTKLDEMFYASALEMAKMTLKHCKQGKIVAVSDTNEEKVIEETF